MGKGRGKTVVPAANSLPRRGRGRGPPGPMSGFGVCAGLVSLRQKLLEFGLVLGYAEPIEEFLESLMFVFETLEGLFLVVIKCSVAAAAAEAGARIAAEKRTSHSFDPDHVEENGKSDWPCDDETHNHDRKPGDPSEFILPAFGFLKPVGSR